jgi:Bacterial Ig-like domain
VAPADSAVVNGYVNAAHDTAAQALTGTAETGSTVTVYDNGTKVNTTTADASTGAWSYTIGQLANASTHSYTVTATDAAGNVSQLSADLSFAVDTAAPTVSSMADTSSGNLSIGGKVTITLTMSEVVTVIGTPTLMLNDGGTATYQSGSGSNKLVFTYTVASTDTNVATLAVTGSNLNGTNVAVRDGAGNNANLNGADVTLSPVVQIYTTDHWTNASGGTWEKASNWGNGVPNAAVDANVDTNGTYTVKINGADTAYALLLNDAKATVSDNSGGALALAGTGGSSSPNGALNINAGTFVLNGGGLKAGTISVASGGAFFVSSGSYAGSSSLAETITGKGAITIANKSNVAFTGAFSESGPITIENSAALDIVGAVTGTAGSFTLMNSANLEFGAAESENVIFAAGAKGTLKLDKSALFTGTISGLTKNNAVDLADLSWVPGKMKATFTGNTSGGFLTVTDGAKSINLNLSGDYTKASWNLSRDRTGGTLVVDPPVDGSLTASPNGSTVTNSSQTAAFALAGNQTSGPPALASDGSGGTTVTDPTTPTTPWPDSPLGWLEQHVPSIVSDLQGFQHGNDFMQLIDQIESWNSPSGTGSTPTGNGPWVQPKSLGSGFDAGWQSHMIQTLASFVDGKGGAPQESAIQLNDQSPQPYLAANVLHLS